MSLSVDLTVTILILNILPLFLEEFFNHSFIHDDAPYLN